LEDALWKTTLETAATLEIHPACELSCVLIRHEMPSLLLLLPEQFLQAVQFALLL
jgi:hypothetical protein